LNALAADEGGCGIDEQRSWILIGASDRTRSGELEQIVGQVFQPNRLGNHPISARSQPFPLGKVAR
jgi:hypothetical protein